LKLDGKDYANEGAVVDASQRPRGERTMTDKISGKVTDTQEINVSADVKTLTMTMHIPGWSEPDVWVFEGE
jgi:hypothetical protein